MNCEKSGKQTKTWEGHTGLVLDSVNGFDVIECEACGFKHIIPIPSPDELDKVYREEYYAKEKPLYIERHREDLDWWNLVYSERYDTFEEYLPPDSRRILDVGSGPGFFLLHGKQRGWQTLGIEPSTQAANHSRELGLEVEEDFFIEGSANHLGNFDVVHLSEVLEHIPDPRGLIKIAHHMLAPEGLVCVVVPNDYNPFQQALRTTREFNPWWVAPPHHINYFNFDTLNRLLESCGFKVILCESTFPIDMFLLMGDNYVDNDKIGRLCHGKRILFEKTLAESGLSRMKRRLYHALAEVGLGREVVVVGQKQ
jgi:SAM-dependent methyltransferase